MGKRIVVACFGDEQSARSIERLAVTANVVAVALDFGGTATLAAMRDLALASGAVRCHALDVREEFARAALLPALRAGIIADPAHTVPQLATAFARKKLDEVARFEHADVCPPDHVLIARPPLVRPSNAPVHLNIGFEDGIPVSINGVPMTLGELMESIETITGESALCVLDREMTRSLSLQHA
jgi:argininosuccinate synthase